MVFSEWIAPMYRLVFKHADFLVINKSPGISVHRDEAMQGLLARISEEQQLSGLKLVHRLDRMTSGLLLLACHGECAAELAAQFRERTIEKYYLALSDRKPVRKQGLIRGDMERSRRGSWKLSKTQDNSAVTQFFSVSVGEKRRLFLLKPATGKTHQLRVAMKSLAAPILGDQRYAEQTSAQQWDRGYLHAYALRFELAGQPWSFVLPPDQGAEFLTGSSMKRIAAWQTPWELEWPALPR